VIAFLCNRSFLVSYTQFFTGLMQMRSGQARPFREIDSLKNMKKAVSNSRKTISFKGNVFLELPNTISHRSFVH